MADPPHNAALVQIARRGADALYAGAIVLLLALLAWNHHAIVFAPVPIDYYEGAMLQLTSVIAAGHNPYTFAFQPASADVYPPLYNLVVAPLTLLFGNTLLLHRAVSACFIVASCVLLYRATRRAGGVRSNALAAAAMCYAALLFYATPIASTNAIGTFMFLASVLVPWARGFDRRGLAIALGCGLLGFYSKQYFCVGLVFVIAYLFLAVSKSRALGFGVLAAAIAAASLVLVQLTSPYFLDNTVFSVGYAIRTIDSAQTMWKQLWGFVQAYAGLLLALAALATWTLARARRAMPWLREALRDNIDLGAGGTPALRHHRPDYFWFCLACSTLVIVLLLGRNPGNYLSYLFQLMSPFLLIASFSLRTLQGDARRVLLALLLFNFWKAYTLLPRDYRIDLAGWQRVDALMQGADRILASPILIEPLVRNGKAVYQNGHTFYFRFAAEKPDFLQPADPERRVAAIWDRYVRQLYRDVENHAFEVVMLNVWDLNGVFSANPPPGLNIDGLEYFKRFYRPSETIRVQMPARPGGGAWPIQVWVPKETGPAE